MNASKAFVYCGHDSQSEVVIENNQFEESFTLLRNDSDSFCYDNSNSCDHLKESAYPKDQITKKCLEMTTEKETVMKVLAAEPTEVEQEDLGMFEIDLGQVDQARIYRESNSYYYDLYSSCQYF